MRWRDSIVFLLPSLALSSFDDVRPTRDCPFHGPVYPSGFDLTKSKAIQNAKDRFPKAIESLFSSGAVSKKQLSFTIDVFSTSTNDSFYSYSHAAPELDGTLTAGVLNDETIFRIGSVSKLYTIYAMIAYAGIEVFDDRVTKYLPELEGNEDPLTRVIWEDVTVGALAAQQGGAGGPALKVAECFENNNCSIQNTLDVLKKKPPVNPPWQSPAYADGGFIALGRVLERLTGMRYGEAIDKILSRPLGLDSTSSTVPKGDSVNALAITNGTTTWAFDNQQTASSGGIYASNADIRKLGLSILNHELLSAATTREWMSPRGHTSSLTYSLGAPWEISRMTIPVSSRSNRTRVSDLYTKGGGNPPYGAITGLSPDHEIGFSIMVAGETWGSDRFTLRDAVAETFITAAELAAEENTAQNFVGTFVDDATNGTNLTLTMEEDLPGLRLKAFYVQGTDMRDIVTQTGDLIVRLYPSGLVVPSSEEIGVTRMAFNAFSYADPPNPRAAIEGGDGLFDYACTGWFTVGFTYVQGHAIDRFVLRVKDGRLVSIEYGLTDSVMKRAD